MPKTSSSAGDRSSGRSSRSAAGKKTAAARKTASTVKKSTSTAKKRSTAAAAKRGTAAVKKRSAAAAAKKGKAAGKSTSTAKKRTPAATAGRKATAKKRSPAARKSTASKKSTPVKKSTAGKPVNKKKSGKTAARKSTTKTTVKSASKRTAKPAAKKKPVAKKAAKRPAIRSARKPGILKKVSKALGKSKKKKTATSLSSLQKVLVAHGVEKKAPAVRPPFPAYRGTMPYIFVSYSHADMKEAFRIIKQLNASRYRIWYDEGIEPGNEWPEVVGRAVLGCSQFIVFMSPTAVESRNVRNEINLATSADKNIIVIYLKNTALSEGLLLQIGTVQYYNKFEMVDKQFVDKLKRVLSNDLHN
jgi:hypothetical protein